MRQVLVLAILLSTSCAMMNQIRNPEAYNRPFQKPQTEEPTGDGLEHLLSETEVVAYRDRCYSIKNKRKRAEFADESLKTAKAKLNLTYHLANIQHSEDSFTAFRTTDLEKARQVDLEHLKNNPDNFRYYLAHKSEIKQECFDLVYSIYIYENYLRASHFRNATHIANVERERSKAETLHHLNALGNTLNQVNTQMKLDSIENRQRDLEYNQQKMLNSR